AHVRQDSPAGRTDFRAPIAIAFGRVVSARVAVVPLILLEEGEFATAGWTRKTDHAAHRRPGAANKGFSMISKNETLRVVVQPDHAETFYRKGRWTRYATITQSVDQP